MENQLAELLGKERVLGQVDLFPYLSMRLHTKAQYFFEAQSEADLSNAIQAAHKLHIPVVLLGGGSNAIFTSSHVSGLVIRNAFQSIVAKDDGKFMDVTVSSGTQMSLFVERTIAMGAEGFEYHKGLPGTVGGAVYMNSKWTKPITYVGDTLISAQLMDKNGMIKTVDKAYFRFAYDYSFLQETKEILISATFKLKKVDKNILRLRAMESIEYRKITQPVGVATCGCYFRNISEKDQNTHHLPTKSAGYLIDKCGMKGYTVGSFSVSTVHANFIVNTDAGLSKPEDLATMVQTIKARVKEKFGVILKEEVQIIS